MSREPQVLRVFWRGPQPMKVWEPLVCLIHIDYDKEYWQHTPLPESNTHCEQLRFNSTDTDKNFWAGIEYLTASNKWPSMLYSHKRPQSFSWGIWSYAFSNLIKTCADVFSILPRSLKNFSRSENLVSGAVAKMKTALGILELWFNCLAAPFLKHLTHTFPERLRRYAMVVTAFFPVFLLCIEMITPAC